MSREIDKLIAEKVLGLAVCEAPSAAPYYVDYGIGPSGEDGELPRYSTDIAAAWEVVEKLRQEDADTVIKLATLEGTSVYTCEISNHVSDYVYSIVADTAAEAICFAALKAKGIDIQDS